MPPTAKQIDALRQRHLGGHIQDGGDAINYDHGLVEGYIDGIGQSDWLPYPENKPEKDGEYLTYNKANDSITVQYFDGRVWGYLATVKPEVTHWTKLPSAPDCG